MSTRESIIARLRPLVDRCWHGHCWVKTDDGPRRIDAVFTAVSLSEHVAGARAYGLCPIAPGTSTTRVACLDFDSHKGDTPWPRMVDTVNLVREALEGAGMPSTAFRSSGGHGVHLYVLWDEPQDAYSVRSALRSALALSGLSSGTKGVAEHQVEVFPKQDEVPADGYGNMFILPLAGGSKSELLFGEFEAASPVPVLERPAPTPPPSTDVPVDLARLKSALDAIPNAGEHELDYDTWRNLVFGVHHATGGSDIGLALVHELSARSSKYDPDFLDNRVWPYVRSDRGGPAITERRVFATAGDHGWQDPAVLEDFDVLEEAAPTEDQGSPDSPKAARFVPVPAHLFAAGKPPSWIIRDVIPKAELGVVYGASGSGKSFLVLDQCMAVARGVPWRGKPTTQGTVVYIAAEGAAGFRNRLNAYSKHHEVPLDAQPLHIIGEAPSFLEKADIVDLVKAVRPLKPSLIVVDTLARVMAGGDENAAQDMGRVVKHCETLHKVTGAMVVFVHHSGKDESRGARGHSSLRAAADTEIEVLRNEQDRVASVTKQKDGSDEALEFGFKLRVVPVDLDDDFEVISSCVVEHQDAANARLTGGKREPKGVKEKLVLTAVRDLVGLSGEHPGVAEVIDAAVAQMPFDQGDGKRDTRRQHAMRALQSLQERSLVGVEDGKVVLRGGQ